VSAAHQLFDDREVRERFLAHYDSLRGQVRTEVVRRHLRTIAASIAATPLRVLDVGCGDGRDSLWLADMGHDVVAADPSEAMLEIARHRMGAPRAEGSIELFHGDVEHVLDAYGAGGFDLVLSHGVLMYQRDPAAFVARHVELLRDGGLLSLLAKNADALVHRAVNEASIDEAIRLLDDSLSVGHLGLPTGAQSIHELSEIACEAGATVRSWAGVRIFTDTPSDLLLTTADDKLIELEWCAARRDPHRHTAALLHVVLHRGVDLGRLPA
jgi:S-adenosylmethionine-dependent methyltransferase